ncbi:hypothetical protein EZS27_027648 [termite gut metagenome]|uniref:Uncharacterized protein n=1 Tax=termite gut metagenome TaxID=433724 RepID=A0A5J4QPI4_9ZZZZ
MEKIDLTPQCICNKIENLERKVRHHRQLCLHNLIFNPIVYRMLVESIP